ncbi:NYN domain-containing protein [Pseudomonas knackmussii]|uniref:NYN domain-containing protein n=1 Tax=Pseudomonas knackmussii TaxID=65741 RepID=UPI003BDE11A7
MERSKIALFIDVENLTHWIKHNGPEALISELGATGQLIVRRAYGNWGNPCVQGFQSELNRLGFELVHNYHPVSKKNSSDIQLTIDVMEYALKLEDVQWFVLATGDSDFSPLFRRLREKGKDVIGVGPKSPLSESVKTSCSKFIYTNTEQPVSKKEIRSAIDDAMDVVEGILRKASGPLALASIKNSILNIDSAFNERSLGFSSFTDFIKSNEFIILNQDPKNKSWSASISTDEQANSLQSTEQSTSLEKQYESLLRKKQWRPVSSNTLRFVYEICGASELRSKEQIAQAVLSHEENSETRADINKAITILIKSGVLKSPNVDPEAHGEKIWSVDKSVNFLLSVDLALVSRLLSSSKEKNIAIEKDALRDFLYGKYDNTTFNALLKEASERAGDSSLNRERSPA